MKPTRPFSSTVWWVGDACVVGREVGWCVGGACEVDGNGLIAQLSMGPWVFGFGSARFSGAFSRTVWLVWGLPGVGGTLDSQLTPVAV